MKSILEILIDFDPIYKELYQWMIKRVPYLNERCMKIWTMLDSYELDFEYHYSIATSRYQGAMSTYRRILHDVEKIKTSDDNIGVYLLLITSLYKNIFIDAQIDRMIYNAVLNKGLFEKKMIDDLTEFSKKIGITCLKILSAIDKTTTNKYINNSSNLYQKEYLEEYNNILNLLSPEEQFKLNYLKEGLSLHKKWEVQFSRINNEIASPLIMEVRSLVWNMMEILGKMPSDEDTRYSSWKLIDYLEENIIPEIWEKGI